MLRGLTDDQEHFVEQIVAALDKNLVEYFEAGRREAYSIDQKTGDDFCAAAPKAAFLALMPMLFGAGYTREEIVAGVDAVANLVARVQRHGGKA